MSNATVERVDDSACTAPAELRPRHLIARRSALGVLAGAAWTVSLPPVGLWWVGPAAVGLLGWAIRGADARQRAVVGLLCGVVVFGTTLRWATLFTIPGYVLLTLVQAAFVAVATALTGPRWNTWLALPAAMTLAEWARSQWPFGGLPVSTLALGQADGPLRPLAAIGGPSLVTLAVAVIGCAAAATIATDRDQQRVAAVAGVVMIIGVAVAVPAAPGTSPVGESINAAVVQGGGPRGLPAARGGTDGVLSRHLAAAATLDDVDLVVLPENVIDVGNLTSDETDIAAVADLARRLDAVVIVGVTVDAPPAPDDTDGGVRRFRNLAVVVEPDGAIGPTYDKVIRVPFGEYVPFRSTVDRFADLSLIPREAVPGDRPGTLDTSLGRIGTLISFEGLHARRARAAVAASATMLAIPTNAASYVTGDIPSQQVAAAQLRATESGRWLLLAGPTGPSAIVAPEGAVQRRSELEESWVAAAAVVPRVGRTPYTVIGDAPTLAAALLAFVFARRRRSTRDLEGDRPQRARRTDRQRRRSRTG